MEKVTDKNAIKEIEEIYDSIWPNLVEKKNIGIDLGYHPDEIPDGLYVDSYKGVMRA